MTTTTINSRTVNIRRGYREPKAGEHSARYEHAELEIVAEPAEDGSWRIQPVWSITEMTDRGEVLGRHGSTSEAWYSEHEPSVEALNGDLDILIDALAEDGWERQ